ncbi:GAF domain-containing protein [Actinomadura kijaniata]|uniref:GAF domain-containing protein n=1 Tax=Actinomadura kijaniata TaxID=46161 RepID=UPI003F1BDE10
MGQYSSAPLPHLHREPADLLPLLSEEHARTQDGRGRGGARPVIRESWERARAAGVDPGARAAPLVFDRDVVADVRGTHPLDRHLPMLRGLLRSVADEAEHLIVVTDELGRALWTEGPPGVRRRADEVGLTEGFCWAENAVGTNGIGTPLVTGRPEYVYSAEHVVSVLHRWSCAGAPVTDPDSGRVLGCVDVSATLDRLHPATVALVGAAARLVEERLADRMRAADDRLRERYGRYVGDGLLVTATGRVLAGAARWRGRRVEVPASGGRLVLPGGGLALAEPVGEVFLVRQVEPPAPDRRPLLALTLLGDAAPAARLDGRPVPLSLRHAEILALLVLHPNGLTGERLAWHLYGEEGSPVTVRAEIHRLRSALGGVVRARPYRLDCEVEADLLAVRRLLEAGEVAAAVRVCRGELLPRSDAPAIRAERDELAVRLRRQVLARGGVAGLWDYVTGGPGRGDLEALERLRALLPPDDPRHAAVAARAATLLAGGE